MIMHWLTSKALGLAKGWWLLIVLAVLITASIIARGWMDRTIQTAVEAGAAEQREKTATTTIERIQEAKDAQTKLDTDPDARRAGCLRHSRTPENC